MHYDSPADIAVISAKILRFFPSGIATSPEIQTAMPQIQMQVKAYKCPLRLTLTQHTLIVLCTPQ